jgi:hypothetical protein
MFKKGDQVKLLKNPLDEQLGDFITIGEKTITDVMDVRHIPGTSGQWVKISEYNDWLDSSWFEAL